MYLESTAGPVQETGPRANDVGRKPNPSRNGQKGQSRQIIKCLDQVRTVLSPFASNPVWQQTSFAPGPSTTAQWLHDQAGSRNFHG